MNQFLKNRWEKEYDYHIVKLIGCNKHPMIEKISQGQFDIQQTLLELYRSKEIKTVYNDFIQKMYYIFNKNENKLFVWIHENIKEILKVHMDKTIYFIKSMYIQSEDFKFEVKQSYFRTQRKLAMIPKFDVEKAISYFETIECSEQLFVVFDIEESIDIQMEQLFLEGKRYKMYHQFSSDIEYVRYIISVKLKEDIENSSNLYYKGDYSKKFLKRAYNLLLKTIEDVSYFEYLELNYNNWETSLNTRLGQDIRNKNKLDYIVSMEFTRVFVELLYKDEKEYLNQYTDFVLKYCSNSPYNNSIDSYKLFTYLESLDVHKEWSEQYYNEHGKICTDRLAKLIELYITKNHKTIPVNESNIYEAEGLSEKDLIRLDRVELLLNEHNMDNPNEKFNFNRLPNGIISVQTDLNSLIEFNPRKLRIKLVDHDFKYIYHNQQSDTALSSYLNAIQVSLFPFENDKLKYILNDIIITAYDLRKKCSI